MLFPPHSPEATTVVEVSLRTWDSFWNYHYAFTDVCIQLAASQGHFHGCLKEGSDLITTGFGGLRALKRVSEIAGRAINHGL